MDQQHFSVYKDENSLLNVMLPIKMVVLDANAVFQGPSSP
jgi:hypothetical protein